MALISPQTVDIDGLNPTYGSCAGGGDTVAPNPNVVLHVKNGDASSHTVTVVVPGTQYAQARPDVAIAIPAGESRFIGPFPDDLADPSDGKVHVTYSAVTAMTVAALRV